MGDDSFLRTIKNHFFWSLHKAGAFDRMCDEDYLKILYRIRTGKKLDLNSPQTYNEKLQWLKLHDRRPEYTTMADKYEVKKYVASIIGKEHIIPNLGVWNSFNEIEFNRLPDQFVLKCTHDSGGIVICKDKSKFDIEKAKKKINLSLNRNYYLRGGREWVYKNIKPRIIAEKYMVDETDSDLKDYKFFCFHGEPKFLYVSKEAGHATEIDFMNAEWERMPFKRNDYPSFKKLPLKPGGLHNMIEISEKLSNKIPFIRVDLYEVNKQIYFSELTFYPANGFMPFEPILYDLILGSWIELPSQRKFYESASGTLEEL